MVKVPEIKGDLWINSRPLGPRDLAGKVVLVDFWTYSCVNCIRTIPHLRALWDKYKNKGFIMIGIHSPEFDFEKNPANVRQAVRDLGIEWPVVLDPDKENWNNFANKYWPSKYLFDSEGNLTYEHHGEGSYEETERAVLRALGEPITLEVKTEEEFAPRPFCFEPTPETYCGYLRGDIANFGGYRLDIPFSYEEPEELPLDSLALSGEFLAKAEYVESEKAGSKIILHFHATEVNLVLAPVENGAAKIKIKLNNRNLPKEIWGQDVKNGEVKIDSPKMYGLVKSKEGGLEGVLEISAKENNFRAYAFTFSGCVE